MKNVILTQEIVSKVTKIIDKIIIENTQSLLHGDYMVRTKYGYQKFYLNWTSGSYDMSLQSLIHYILAEENIYKQILNEDQFAKCIKVIKDEPEAIYYPNGDSVEDLEVQDLLDTIYYKSIAYTGKKLLAMGLKVFHDFKDYLND
jgi:hypothetical protein